VVALCAAPFLLDDPNAPLLFPADVIERARKLVGSFGIGGVGGYTDSRGNPMVRGEVADFIQARDGFRPETEVRVLNRLGFRVLMWLCNGSGACGVQSWLTSSKQGRLQA
jgi:glutamate--glyoxylate aminotransferase